MKEKKLKSAGSFIFRLILLQVLIFIVVVVASEFAATRIFDSIMPSNIDTYNQREAMGNTLTGIVWAVSMFISMIISAVIINNYSKVKISKVKRVSGLGFIIPVIDVTIRTLIGGRLIVSVVYIVLTIIGIVYLKRLLTINAEVE